MREQDDRPAAAAPTERRRTRLDTVLMGLTVALVLVRLLLVVRRFFDPDEFEHAHAAWCMSKGLIPYKDFFEHHTPWYYVFLRQLFRWFQPESSFDVARRFLLVARTLSVALTVAALALVVRLGRTWHSRRVGWLAAFLLAAQPFFLKKSIEIRPDVLALPFFLYSLWALLRGLSLRAATPTRRWWFGLGGLCLGCAMMCTQKMLFVLPGVLAGLGLWFWIEERRARAVDVVLFLVAVLLPAMATCAAFARVHAAWPFIANNFLLNARWKQTPTGQLIRLFATSGPVIALAAYHAFRTVPRLLRPEQRDPGDALLFCLLVWLFLAVAVMPAPQMQYYLMPLPLLCLFAARAVDEWAARAGRRLWPWALGALSILPAVNLGMDAASNNQKQFAQLRQVFGTTKPTDVVMDGWQGMGVFRPHAFYYYFVHDELLQMMSPERLNAFVDDLETGRVRPVLIALDRRLVALGPRFRAFVNAHYTTRDGFFYYWVPETDSASK